MTAVDTARPRECRQEPPDTAIAEAVRASLPEAPVVVRKWLEELLAGDCTSFEPSELKPNT